MKKNNSGNFLVQIISTNKVIRSVSLIADLNKQEIEFQIVPGVIPDKSAFDQGFLHDKKLTGLLAQRDLTIGEVGCALAHKSAAINLLKSDFSFGLTFEDDAEILTKIDFKKLSKKLDCPVPIVINLGWIPGYAIAYEFGPQQNNDFAEVITPPTCAFAYAFNRSAAEQIALEDTKVIDLADWPVNMLHKTKFFVVNPAWVHAQQDPRQSIIGIRISSQSQTVTEIIYRKLKFIVSFFNLLVLSRFVKPKLGAMQIIHRFIFRDFIYSYGNKNLKGNSNLRVDNNIVFLGSKSGKVCKFFKF